MCLFPKRIKVCVNDTPVYMDVPCGKCIECLRLRISDWCFRLKSEMSISKYALFVTLTYSDEFLPLNGLEVSDLQKHFKRVRKRIETFRYFGIGEYGTNFHRPHYHYILFTNDDIKYKDFFSLINSSWSKGFVYVKPLTIGRIVYCVSYLMAQSTPEGKNKCFTVMSKRPAIGSHLLENSSFVKQIIDNDFSFVYSKGHKVHCPRYYKRKLKTDGFSLIDYYLLNCKKCALEYNKRFEYLDKYPERVSDSRSFLSPFSRYLYSKDFENFSRYVHEENLHKDFTIKQRNKKTRLL